jgi:phospholipid/cholesterol/gamma-HCH transport system substrate-binding protein
MRIPAENYFHEDSKGYVDIRLYVQEPFFYLFQIASSEKGFLDRLETERTFFEPQTLERVDLAEVPNRVVEKTHDLYREKQLIFRRNAIRFGFQFGTTYRMLTVRFGIFEGYAGIGFDVDFSLVSNKFRFISTFEAFDFNGFNRKDDRRPHLKWLNRLFFTQNIYFSIGADDFVSKKNANVFFGGGIRFGDDDIKYLLGGFSGAASSVIR